MKKQETAKRSLMTVAVAGLVAVATLAGGVTAQAADANPTAGIAQPDLVSLLKDYENYYQPTVPYDKKDPSSFGKGTVRNVNVLKHNDESTQAINNKAAEGSTTTNPTAQQKRALVDADYNFEETFPDALGPVLGGYLKDGLAQSANANGSVKSDGPLAKTYQLLQNNTSDLKAGEYSNSLLSDYISTSTAKTTFNHPRPYVDRTNGGYPAAGLQKTLNIKKVPVWDGHDPEYDGMVQSGSFPSGHTTYAYSGGIGLAMLLPELGTEIVTRASEAGNNRIVLGVHYSLDIMGGRIDGEAANTALWSNEQFRNNYLMPAHSELENYIAGRCSADGYGKTVAECVANLNALQKKTGDDPSHYRYTNDFTDVVSTKPVTDRASAIDAYTARMTYGFKQVGKSGQAATVPQGAENLLITAFPSLSDAQRRAVLAASEIDSGYPLDSSSEGYQRINLAKAYSANVTLSEDKSTILGITFGNDAPKVTVVKADQIAKLLADFGKYWKPGVGVTEEGKSVLAHDDALTEEINNDAAKTAGSKNDQTARAYSDSKMDPTLTLYDALGPVLGKYYKDGMDGKQLPQTAKFLTDMSKSASTGVAKNVYSHPRPFIDRINYMGTTLNLQGLQQTLNITKTPAYETDPYGYDALANSGSFPSGHTTYAFTLGAGLSTILPEFGTEIMTRVSEAGNNRIVLGVHYPLDILGGHIAGQYGVATALNDASVKSEAASARTELVTYLTSRCKADGNGDTLTACIAKTDATGKNGYHNSFTDQVSKAPVTDRASALTAYQARMTYGFAQTGKSGESAKVPDAAVNLLDNVDAFKGLTKDQKKQVLAKTEGDSGYPLDASSEGWARVNLAAAYSAKVTLSKDGQVVSVEPGQEAASVVREGAASGTNPKPANGNGTNSAQTPSGENNVAASNQKSGALSSTGVDIAVIAVVAMMLVGTGLVLVLHKRHV